MSAYAVAKRSVPACRTDTHCLCDPPFDEEDAKTRVFRGKPQNEPCIPDFPIHTKVSGVWYIHNSRL